MTAQQTILGSSGAGSNPLNARPLAIDKLKMEKQRLEKYQANANALISDLAGPGGKIVKTIISKFINRVEKLITDDSDCRLYMDILKDIEVQMDVAGSQIVKNKLNKIISKLGDET